MRIKRIHHLTVAVRDVERARATFEALFGAAAEESRDLDAFGVRTCDVRIGDDVLQLASPLHAGGPVTRFIERKGEGFYNLALEVDDLDGAIAELAERGIKVSEPIEASPGVRSSFVTMAATHGLSIQLVEAIGGEEMSSAEAEGTSSPAAIESADEAMTEALTSDDSLPEAATPPLDLTPDEWSDTD